MKNIKKLVMAVLCLGLLTCNVYAEGSPTIEPKGNDDPSSYTIYGEDADRKILIFREVQPVENQPAVNALIEKQNANYKEGVLEELVDILKTNGYDWDEDYVIAGKGFSEVDVVWTSDYTETHDGAKYEVSIPQMTNLTDKVVLVHYSLKSGFQLIEADKFDKAKGTAVFTLHDTSPVMYLLKYNTASADQPYVPAKTGVDARPIVDLKAVALLVCSLAAITAFVIKEKNHYSKW